jgi:hypothetical protein
MPPPYLSRTFFERVHRSYARLERPISSISLLGGFAFDALTLKRIDMFWENFWVLAHLLVVGACIVLANRRQSVPGDANALEPAEPSVWLVSVLQFAFGGLLSTFLVFYFRSGSLWVSWPFFLILAAAFAANESLKKHYARLDFQVSFFFLSLFAFAIFIVPVVVHAMGWLVFVLSGAVSLGLLWLFLRVLGRVAPETTGRGRRGLLVCVAAIYVAINVLYFLNLIPPIPLSLQDASVAHSISRTVNGNYAVQMEDPGWLRFFRPAEVFHGQPGERVYAYTAVFSPTFLRATIVHEWQMYDGKRGWVTMSRVELPLIGGRDGGYRTYSVKTGIKLGAWRVIVETPSGAILGRLRFNVVQQEAEPDLKDVLKD